MTTNEVQPKTVIVRDNTVPPEVGRDVMYILSEADTARSAGEVRPAKIVALVADGSIHGLVNLQIFTNGRFDALPNVHHAKNVLHDENLYDNGKDEHKERAEGHRQGTWHWPPPRELVFKGVQIAAEPPPPEDSRPGLDEEPADSAEQLPFTTNEGEDDDDSE